MTPTFYICNKVPHDFEEIAQAEADRLSNTVLADYDRPITHITTFCAQHNKWHVSVDPREREIAKEARRAKENQNRIEVAARSRSHYKNNGQPKRGYNSHWEAQQDATMLEVKEGQGMTVYQCAECHLWHVGHARNNPAAVEANNERLDEEQDRIGYAVSNSAPQFVPVQVSPSAVVPVENNKFLRLQQLPAEIETTEQEINHLTERLAALKDEGASIMRELNTMFAPMVGSDRAQVPVSIPKLERVQPMRSYNRRGPYDEHGRRKVRTILCPDGHVEDVSNMSEFCRLHGLLQTEMSKVATGKIPQHHGYRLVNPKTPEIIDSVNGLFQ